MTHANNFEKSGSEMVGGDRTVERSRFLKQAARLTKEVPIARVIGEYTRLRRTGKALVGRCPRHDEPNPTLRVHPKTNTFDCVYCGMQGDAIDFLEAVEDLTYGQALEALEKLLYADEYPDAA